MTKNRQIAVVGAGLMGHAIALTLARAGQYVTLYDPVPAVRAAVPDRITASLHGLGEAEDRVYRILKRIEICDTIPVAVREAQVVFEAVPEDLPLKQRVFAEIEAAAPETAILASNTSVIPITQIMGGLRLRGRALGTHWWNPAHLIPLVEVIRTEWTDEAAMQDVTTLLADAGKTPVRVEKDVPGFIGNRLQNALWREAISLVERGICDAEAVDTVVKLSFGRRLAVLGPLENADLVGTDLTLAVHGYVLADLEGRAGPSPLLQKLVADGELGMKSGQGFHRWTPDTADAVRKRLARFLPRLGEILDDEAPGPRTGPTGEA